MDVGFTQSKAVGTKKLPAASKQPNRPHSCADFQAILERERLRADRSRLPFSMIEIEIDADGCSVEAIVPVVQARVRTTDEIGWLRDGRLGIIAPYTDGRGATRLAEALVSRFPPAIREPEIKIYEYEVTPEVPRDEASDSAEQRPAVEPPQLDIDRGDIDELFVRAIPFWKRMTDIFGAIGGMIVLSPLFLFVAVAIKLCSPGPVFFVQRRTGLAGKPFHMYKFRTMVVDAEARQQRLLALNEQDGPAFKIGCDPRITWIGHWLRRLSIDELPQLANVLKGDMSLVGPRPLPCAESDGCQSWQKRRLTVTPGMTCSWQVHDRSIPVPFEQWMRMDVRYTESRTLARDLRLLLLTLLFIVGLRGR